MYSKIVIWDNDYVKVKVLRDGTTIDSRSIGYIDCSIYVWMFKSAEEARPYQFKLAHKWADSLITLCKEKEQL